MFAVAAVGAGCDDAFALGEAGEKDVEEAAEGQAEQSGEDGSYELEAVEDGISLSCAFLEGEERCWGGFSICGSHP